MDGTSTPTTSTQPAPAGGARRRLPSPRRAGRRLAGVAALALVVVIAAAIIPGSHSGGATRFDIARLAARASARNGLPIHEAKVFGSNIPANRYGSLIGAQENQGVDAHGQLSSDLSPVSARTFARPIAAYRAYAERWTIKLTGAVSTLRTALAANRRGAGERDWATAFADYLHLGAVYGLLPAGLDRSLAGLPPALGDRDFPGLHRIEMGLWTGAAPDSLVATAAALARAVTALRHALPTVAITPLQYATRAHEILEDAQRDFMSGADVPWSGAGVLGTDAGVAATREVIATLAPVMQGRDNTLVASRNWLYELQQTIGSVQRRDGSWPSVGQLSITQRERINGALAGTLAVLSQVPGTLETTDVPVIRTIASEAKR
jgi:hypothetical protein